MITVLDLLHARVAELAGKGGKNPGSSAGGKIVWDAKEGKYRKSGQFISEKDVLALGSSYSENVIRPALARSTERFLSGAIDLPTWQREQARLLKEGYSIQYMIGRGGIKQMDFSDNGRLGGRLKFEYNRLDLFAKEIYAGALSPEQIRFRASMYADGVRTAYFDGKTSAAKASGGALSEERRVLGEAEHCDDCIAYAAQEWQPIGTLPPPGIDSVCRHNCQCEMEYR